MRYQQTIAIHDRIEEVLRLIKTGRYSTPALAQEVGVSVPTISRIVATLREAGHAIHAERTQKGWRYTMRAHSMPRKHTDQSNTATKGGRPR